MKSIFILFIFLMFHISVLAQVQVIPTGTSALLNQINYFEGHYYVSGNGFYAKCHGLCDSLIILNKPTGTTEISSPKPHHLNIVDTALFYKLYYNFSGWGINGSRVLKSVDGGKNWETVFVIRGDDIYVTLTMFDSLEGFISGLDLSIPSSPSKILRTTDGGATWIEEPSPVYRSLAAANYGDSMVVIAGIDGICVSNNRGHTWSCDDSKIRFISERLPIIKFYNQDTIFLLSDMREDFSFSHSFNNGLTWNHVPIQPADSYWVHSPANFDFVSSTEGYFLQGNNIFRTKDFGNTWVMFSPGFSERLYDIKFMNDSIALISGENGLLFKWNKNTSFPTTVKEIDDRNKVKVQVSPNPTNNFQTINFSLEQPSELEITLHDISGRLVKTIHKGKSPVGETTIEVDLSSLAKGMYLYCVSIDGEKQYFKTVSY